MSIRKVLLVATCAIAQLLAIGCSRAVAQGEGQMVRLAKLVVDPAQLDAYKAALKEEVEASLRLEPGVLILYPVSDKERPSHFTILEIYASRAAYEQHIKSAHFLKYKTGTAQMVKSLELIDATPLLPGMQLRR